MIAARASGFKSCPFRAIRESPCTEADSRIRCGAGSASDALKGIKRASSSGAGVRDSVARRWNSARLVLTRSFPSGVICRLTGCRGRGSLGRSWSSRSGSHLAAGRSLVAPEAPQGKLALAQTPLPPGVVANPRPSGALQPRRGADNPLPLPRQEHPDTVAGRASSLCASRP